MKLITAIIRENKLDQVREALVAADIQRITVSRVSGHGQQMGFHESLPLILGRLRSNGLEFDQILPDLAIAMMFPCKD